MGDVVHQELWIRSLQNSFIAKDRFISFLQTVVFPVLEAFEHHTCYKKKTYLQRKVSIIKHRHLGS